MALSRLWPLAGTAAGVAGLATSYVAAMALTIRQSPVVAVAEGVTALTPGAVVERAIGILGGANKVVLILGVLLALLALCALAGHLARGSAWKPLLVWVPLALVGAVAVLARSGSGPGDLLPVVIGFVTWVVVLSLLSDRLTRAEQQPEGSDAADHQRRVFLGTAGAVVLLAAAASAFGGLVGRGRRHVEESRRLLRLTGISAPSVPVRASVGLRGVSPWMTPAEDFYLIHTALAVPAIEPSEWRLRIHGMVERELTITYDDLLARRRTEAWITLGCVSNEVGSDLIGNAWWSGVALRGLLAEAGVAPEADCVVQTSDDGWDCSTPLAALTDPDRDAMLAVAMNGRPLPLEHGFPVRTVVPGLYGYVSATKWVVDLEVTRFDAVETFWTSRGWSEQGPVKIGSRIDVPQQGADVVAGDVRVGGMAWAQHTGIAGVEVALDGGAWQPAEVGGSPSVDTWVQWVATLECQPGDHVLRVRAVGADGEVQTGVERDVLPDGATGWHEVRFSAE